MTPLLILLAVIVALIAGYLILSRKPTDPFLAVAEYWVYQPGTALPDQNAMMTRMVGQNPYAQKGKSPIGPAEGLLFSDVRLHIAIVRRSENAHVFRPDLFSDIEVGAEALKALAAAESFVKLRYLSEEPLDHRRHLQFLLHAADAVAEIGGGTLIYDRIGERLFSKEELEAVLSDNWDATAPEIHLRTVWKPQPHGGYIETKGLRKIGHKDLKTETIESDEAHIVSVVVKAAADRIWTEPAIGETVEVEAYDDRFQVILDKDLSDSTPIRVLRIQTS